MTFFPPPADRLQGARSARIWILAGLLCIVFFTDLLTPLGFAHGVLYVPAIILGAVFLPAWALLLVGAACGLLTVAGWMLSPEPPQGISAHVAATNRLLTLLAIALTTVSSAHLVRHRRGQQEAELEARTMSRLLSMASEVGHLGAWQYDTLGKKAIWSPEVAFLHGLTPQQAPSLEDLLARYAPRDRLRFVEQLGICAQTHASFEDEYQIRVGSQAPRWVRVRGRALVELNGHCTIVEGTIQDVSHYKEIRLELTSSLNNWKRLAETLPVIIWTANADHKLTYASQSLSDYAGKTVHELLTAGWTKLVHEEDLAIILAAWPPSDSSGASFEAVFRIRRRDGQYRWHLARATRLKLQGDLEDTWYGTAVDIEDRIRLENDVKRAAWRYENLLESMTDAIFALDANWCVTLMNHQAEVLLDRQKADLIGRNVWDEFPAAVGTKFQTEYGRCMQQAEVVRFEEWYGPLGKLFEVNAYPSSDGITVFFRDITVQRKLSEQLTQSQKLESVGHLTGGIAHDFNNLLTVIQGNSDLLLEGGPRDPEHDRLIRQINAAAASGATMVRRLLAFAREQELSPEAIDVNQLAEGMNELLRRTLGEDIQIALQLAPDLPKAVVDEVQLESALLNLAINARDAMPDGGRLTISTALTANDAADLQATRHAPTPFVRIEVADTGQGMTPDTLARVFDPFFTTKPKGKGSGLGMAMVHGFIRQSSGFIAIASEPGTGTRVTMYLPVSRQDAAKDERASGLSTSEIPAGQGELVLLVEDDDLVRSYASIVLGKLGYQVLMAPDGPSALELVRSRPDIDLLFTDVIMPGGMTGPELVTHARELRPQLPALFASGYTEDAMNRRSDLSADYLLLTKPYKKADLARKLRQALDTSPADR